jgi:hypothetical protein
MIPEHARLEACLKAFRETKPPYRPPIRPWRFLEVGEAILVPTAGSARKGARWVWKKYGWTLSRKKQRDGSGWLVRRVA